MWHAVRKTAVMTEECVCVAVRVRPLLAREVLHRHQVCVRVVPGSAQVMLGSDRLFSFDHAFGPTASQDEVYESCVQPLVESCVQGSNATVFCYGQTGSGKTYTLGGGNQGQVVRDPLLNIFSLVYYIVFLLVWFDSTFPQFALIVIYTIPPISCYNMLFLIWSES